MATRAKAILFDLDNTLCDYASAVEEARDALKPLLHEAGITEPGQFWQTFATTEAALYERFLAGELSRDVFRILRFAETLGASGTGARHLSAKLNALYMARANSGVRLFDDVRPTLAALRGADLVCALLTNGPSDGQRKKLAQLDLEREVSPIFISEEIGLAKPDRACFEHVLRELGLGPTDAVMVGDSVHDDMLGALAVGMPGVLVDRWDEYGEFEGPRIRTLAELPGMLKELAGQG